MTSGFGTEPWSEWVSPHGRFVESPVPDQFYVLPDEYRLTFDRQSGMPSMMVLLVPPKKAAGEETAMSFGGDYTLRSRFSVVPWVDPARMELLRDEIAKHTGIAYPQLLVGGIRSATCALSRPTRTSDRRSSVDGEAQLSVDPQRLRPRARLHERVLQHAVPAARHRRRQETSSPRSSRPRPTRDRRRPHRLASRPAGARLPVRRAHPAGAPAPSADPTLVATEPVPVAPPTLRVTNPMPYAVTVGALRTSLLVIDDTLPTPIGAVAAKATRRRSRSPPPRVASPASIEVVLARSRPSSRRSTVGVGVGFLGVDVDIDPRQVLAKAHDIGTSADLSSTVEVRSYQLEHPDVLPEPLADVFGVEVQLRRYEAEPVTIFLTRDQPTGDVQVSFSLADIIAGARPEQPNFSWRRRNLAGKGNGEWSEWETIIGRQLFISPTGM